MDHFAAYIDAGTGSMILQVAIASVLALPFLVRSHMARAATFVRAHVVRHPAAAVSRATHR
jgi:hypothetical protein